MIRVPDGLQAKYDTRLEEHGVPTRERQSYRRKERCDPLFREVSVHPVEFGLGWHSNLVCREELYSAVTQRPP